MTLDAVSGGAGAGKGGAIIGHGGPARHFALPSAGACYRARLPPLLAQLVRAARRLPGCVRKNAVNPSMGAPAAPSMARTVLRAHPGNPLARRPHFAARLRCGWADAVARRSRGERALRCRTEASPTPPNCAATVSARRRVIRLLAHVGDHRGRQGRLRPSRRGSTGPSAAWTPRPEPPGTGLRRPRRPSPIRPSRPCQFARGCA